MEIKKAAMAGTLESSDAQVTVEPGKAVSFISLESRFGQRSWRHWDG